MKKYANEDFKGSVRIKGHWQGAHELKEGRRNLGSTRKRYDYETHWENEVEKGTVDQDDAAPAEHPKVLEPD